MKFVTLPNIVRNCPEHLSGVRLFSGDWKDVAKLLEREGLHYDVILGSDTVYCPESLNALLKGLGL